MKPQQGFSLIELMIVVGVIGILAAVAYPAYQDYVIRAKRGDAMNALASLRIAQEKYRANNSSFAGGASNINGVDYSESPDGYWTIEIVSAGSSDFAAKATSKSPHTDGECSPFLVDRNGASYATGFASADCWER